MDAMTSAPPSHWILTVWPEFTARRAARAKRMRGRAYRARNADQIKREKDAYRARNKDVIAQRKRIYRAQNRARIAASDRDYRERNRAAIAQRKRDYKAANRDSIAQRDSDYKKAHRAEINANKRRRTLQDADYRLANNLRRRLGNALNGRSKAAPTLELLGCSVARCRAHLEKQFVGGMSWDNRADWHIDHIRPIASFNLADPVQQRICFHYTNLQPLWARDNLAKGAKFPTCLAG